jgi:hypothetical protein
MNSLIVTSLTIYGKRSIERKHVINNPVLKRRGFRINISVLDKTKKIANTVDDEKNESKPVLVPEY